MPPLRLLYTKTYSRYLDCGIWSIGRIMTIVIILIQGPDYHLRMLRKVWVHVLVQMLSLYPSTNLLQFDYSALRPELICREHVYHRNTFWKYLSNIFDQAFPLKPIWEYLWIWKALDRSNMTKGDSVDNYKKRTPNINLPLNVSFLLIKDSFKLGYVD